MKKINQFLTELKELQLPIEDYLIVSSGVMAIHNIRECNDLDVLISEELFNTLAEKYSVETIENVSKINLGNIECLYRTFNENDQYNFYFQRSHAETIDGFPFQSLELCLFFKKKSGREKDQKDVKLIEEYLQNKNTA